MQEKTVERSVTVIALYGERMNSGKFNSVANIKVNDLSSKTVRTLKGLGRMNKQAI